MYSFALWQIGGQRTLLDCGRTRGQDSADFPLQHFSHRLLNSANTSIAGFGQRALRSVAAAVRGRPFSAAEQLTSLSADVRMLHQRLAHQDGLGAALRQALDIGVGVDAAFSHQKRRRAAGCVSRVE